MINRINKNITKLVNDTLKSPNGKYSRKSLTMFTSYGVAIIMGFYIVVCYSEHALFVFYGFLAMATGQSILALKDKIESRNSNKNTSNDRNIDINIEN